jgi:hypothetical protein
MIFKASDEDMRVYSAIVQRIAHLDYQKEQLLAQMAEWEQAHAIPEEIPETEPGTEQPVE